jgi:hypothetical protein
LNPSLGVTFRISSMIALLISVATHTGSEIDVIEENLFVPVRRAWIALGSRDSGDLGVLDVRGVALGEV